MASTLLELDFKDNISMSANITVTQHKKATQPSCATQRATLFFFLRFLFIVSARGGGRGDCKGEAFQLPVQCITCGNQKNAKHPVVW